MDTLALVVTVLGSVITATWVLRTKLSEIELAIRAQAEKAHETFALHDARIIKLERKRR